MAYENMIYEKKGRIAYITLNRPRVLNALSGQLNRELHDALLDFRDDPEVWVSIINGAGDRAFSSGHDLKEDTVAGFEEAMTTSFWRPGTATIYGTLETGEIAKDGVKALKLVPDGEAKPQGERTGTAQFAAS